MGDRGLVTQIIINKMEEKIKCDLTTGREDNDLEPIYEINNNIRNEIKIWAKKMYDDYEKDNELDEITNNTAMPDWYREYIDYNKLDKLV